MFIGEERRLLSNGLKPGFAACPVRGFFELKAGVATWIARVRFGVFSVLISAKCAMPEQL